MAVTKWHDKKIDNVSYLSYLLSYITKENKTNNHEFIKQHLFDFNNGITDFLAQTEKRKFYNDRLNIKREYDMFYISFPIHEKDKNLIFNVSEKIVDEYLKNEYQYILTMHQDQEHYHVHCLFNCSNVKTNKMFDTSKKNMIDNLRKISNKICIENGLSIIENPNKKTNITQKEYYVRKHNRSFKSKTEKLIDNIILESKNIDDFKQKLSEKIEVEFKDFSFKIKPINGKKFIRNSTLGTDYLLQSIEYRINHKSEEFNKKPRFKFIDTSSDKFNENYYLKQWADKKNAEHSGELFNQAKAIAKLETPDIKSLIEKEYLNLENIEKNIMDIDKNIEELMIARRLHEKYPVFIPMMKEYKSLSSEKEKQEYKKANIKHFKEYDLSKKYINKYKDEFGKKRELSYFTSEIKKLKVERDNIYKNTYNIKRNILEYQRTYEISKKLNLTMNKSKSKDIEK